MESNKDYIASEIPAEPLKVYLDENGTTIDIESPLEGATLNLSSKDIEPIELQAQEPQQQLIPTRTKFLQILRAMVASEQITQRQATEMRRRFGISNASFHAKKVDQDKKKRKKALAYNNKKTNRHNGSTKGQSMRSGRTG